MLAFLDIFQYNKTPLYNFFKIKDAAQGTSMYNKFATLNQQRSDLIRQIYYTTKKI